MTLSSIVKPTLNGITIVCSNDMVRMCISDRLSKMGLRLVINMDSFEDFPCIFIQRDGKNYYTKSAGYGNCKVYKSDDIFWIE